MRRSLSFLLLLAAFAAAHAQEPQWVWLDDLPLTLHSEGIRPVKAGRNYQGDTMRISGAHFFRGIGLQSVSVIPFELGGRALRFRAVVGADDRGNPLLPIRFHVLADGRLLYRSAPMAVGSGMDTVDLDLRGVRRLGLLVVDTVGGVANKRTYGEWADARILMQAGFKPQPVPAVTGGEILTPPPPASPRIHSARVFGARPGHPVVYTVAATGERPLLFRAKGLPEGLRLDEATGILGGRLARAGEYRVTIAASNRHGSDTLRLRLRIGDTLSLTPPMGWNGWNSWAGRIDRDKVMASARAMVRMGLADLGWSYVNIDDTWQGVRGGPRHALQPNDRFPDIGAMADSIHALGLRAGLYSTPYVSTYAGYPGGSSDSPVGGETHEQIRRDRQPYMRIGPHRFEEADAWQMAAWGFDFLKYDWRMDVPSAERMQAALRASGRDILLSLSNNAPFDRVRDWQRTSNLWRTGPDIRDSWNSVYMTGFTLDRWAPFGGPGHWNDPDMMVVGNVTIGTEAHPSRLTPDEQYSHVSIYALLSAPMLIGCPIEQLDAFTLNLLTNAEVLAVNQDPLGRPARLLSDTLGVQTWMKPLEDGSFAVGYFHTADYGRTPRSYFRWDDEPERLHRVRLSELGLQGDWKARDLWRQRDMEGPAEGVSFRIPHHGVRLLRLTRR